MKKALLVGFCAALAGAYACGADPLYYEETDTVITVRPESAKYSSYETYYMPTSIVDLCLQPSSGEPTSDAIGGAAGGPAIDPDRCSSTDRSADEGILEALEDNMDDMGYVRVEEDNKDEADVALLVGFVSRSSWSLAGAYCYPNYYYGGCVEQDENPSFVVPHNSLILQLIDVDASSGEELQSVWTAGIHQAQKISAELGTSTAGGPSETKDAIWRDAIDQAFSQSAYLNEGGE